MCVVGVGVMEDLAEVPQHKTPANASLVERNLPYLHSHCILTRHLDLFPRETGSF